MTQGLRFVNLQALTERLRRLVVLTLFQKVEDRVVLDVFLAWPEKASASLISRPGVFNPLAFGLPRFNRRLFGRGLRGLRLDDLPGDVVLLLGDILVPGNDLRFEFLRQLFLG